ncbi:DUF5050 domain-containing protein [Acetivibrio ethanolgignens]|uniref:Prolow-density lipoprotein receptor-related protein 1-like beta-propeller domain-containing protein n=1 Tax=Acetivibrio ethanolgignens TaxID=290052 RepID=A0A0V8QCR8_9FIRM|nr:DUF5050 domain-containing protein [Acetivibrio ethanolgignens]KSV58324.1 hypothetical protein ASU35_02655 [Acetivibrio ethanolgignens]
MRKWIITVIVFLVIGGGFGTFAYLNTRTVWNSEGSSGNFPGNLNNEGLFCEDGDTIYFSNPKDDGALYSMNQEGKEFKKIHADKVSSINVTGEYIVYVRDNHNRAKNAGNFFSFNNVGIYRIRKKNSGDIKQLYNDPAGVASLYGNYIYYQHYNTETNLEFYKVKLDGSEEEKLSAEPILPGSYEGGYLYYNGVKKDHDIHTLNLSNNQVSDIAFGNYFSILAQGGSIYYLDLAQNYAIGRMDTDGSNPELLVRDRCSFFNLSPDNRYLYYQIDGIDHNRLCQLDLVTMEEKIILEGDFCKLNVTSRYLFFQDFHLEQWYQYTPSTSTLKPFSPPVLVK